MNNHISVIRALFNIVLSIPLRVFNYVAGQDLYQRCIDFVAKLTAPMAFAHDGMLAVYRAVMTCTPRGHRQTIAFDFK